MWTPSVVLHEFLFALCESAGIKGKQGNFWTFSLCLICNSFWSGKYFINRDIFNLSSLVLANSLNAMVCSRCLMVFVIFRECGPGTSVTGYVCPTTNRFFISRM
jgi:hypothetical protein